MLGYNHKMVTDSQKIKMLSKCFGRYSISNDGKNASVVCPYCASKGKITEKKKLSISLDSGVYHCWVCETKGRNIGRAALKFCTNKKDASTLLEYFGGSKNRYEEEVVEEAVQLPEDFRLITNLNKYERSQYKNHLKYLENRGLTVSDFHRFRIGVSDAPEYSNYVIFPSNDADGKLNYFIARSIDSNNFKRYKNCSVSRKEIIFREFDIDFSKEIVLVEGVFDLINCPENSTCILGSWIDEKHLVFQKIVQNMTPVVLCLDPDARSKSIKIFKMLNSYCVPVRMSNHRYGDFGDMSKDDVTKIIDAAKGFDFAQSVRYLIENINSGSII